MVIGVLVYWLLVIGHWSFAGFARGHWLLVICGLCPRSLVIGGHWGSACGAVASRKSQVDGKVARRKTQDANIEEGVAEQCTPKFFTLRSSLFTKKSVALQRNPKSFTIHHSPFTKKSVAKQRKPKLFTLHSSLFTHREASR